MIEATRKETVVRQRYAAAAKDRAEKLCCPVDYSSEYLAVIPQEVIERGKRYAVCDKTYNLYKKKPYRDFFEFVDPIADVPLAQAKPFDCAHTAVRHPKETKGLGYNATTEASSKCCDDGGSC